ncbi:hypothetical protein PPL_05986 [Heterostelium album PN500]|uniref:Uncharacterized protein n=1 Tax=Heterostelium pallidum (strain ATCC 26659 / Pp 5 / PN500) TaxID=670386 RepID=D3BBW6_HETP5|nr:hypothetical protein PPL_05986 [Heterostelium album PN500]EFA81149.1 hypothetical protein PPL_05986 [Heterostelium album PN500]|eukprot:XP_020433267.1 hypothetical protein PPL_05986 [Heterostelium album PN500]
MPLWMNLALLAVAKKVIVYTVARAKRLNHSVMPNSTRENIDSFIETSFRLPNKIYDKYWKSSSSNVSNPTTTTTSIKTKPPTTNEPTTTKLKRKKKEKSKEDEIDD